MGIWKGAVYETESTPDIWLCFGYRLIRYCDAKRQGDKIMDSESPSGVHFPAGFYFFNAISVGSLQGKLSPKNLSPTIDSQTDNNIIM